LPEDRYALPAQPLEVPLFQGEKFNKKELEQQLRRSELDDGAKRPLLPLSINQIGLIGGSSMINGPIECDSPHIIKGWIVKVVRTETEDQYSERGRHMGAAIRETMEVSELMKRLTGRNYPVFVDNMEPVEDLANVRPTGQVIMAKCVRGTDLSVLPLNPLPAAGQKAA